MGRHTVTGMLCAQGQQFSDWTAAYRLFSKERVPVGELFGAVRRGVCSCLAEGEPLVVAMDDTLAHKRGTRIPGTSWRRDPLGPPFADNFIWAQRFLQISAALPPEEMPGPGRVIPITLVHAPSPRKPRKSADEACWEQYRDLARASALTIKASEALEELRCNLDAEGQEGRGLVVVADGGYTNARMIRGLPERCVFIGRARTDARLYHPPEGEHRGPGRKRIYGERAQTPEQMRQDEAIPWQTVKVHAAGRVHDFRVKTVASLLWRSAGDIPLRLVIIAPLSYRPRQGSRLLYRKPAYLICTDTDLSLEKIVQYYVWRWDVEVNFRDEKQLIGMGQAQVRSAASVEGVPAFAAASYAILLLAAHLTYGSGEIPGALPAPKWRSDKPKPRTTTKDLIQQLRAELWGQALHPDNFSGFVNKGADVMKLEKWKPDLASTVLYVA